MKTSPYTVVAAYAVAFTLLTTHHVKADITADFGDVNLNTPPATASAGGVYNNGGPVTNTTGFTSHGIGFSNSYYAPYDSWSGFSYSTTTDTATAGFGNQYSAITGSGVGGSGAYGVAYNSYPGDAVISLPTGFSKPISLSITNTTYAYLTMRDGDGYGFSKKFGGVSGNDPDYFRLTIQALDALSQNTGTPIIVTLADFTFANNAQDYILNTWLNVDLSPLGDNVSSIIFDFASSDVGSFGINTPTYFAVDNIAVAVPEPSTWAFYGVLLTGLAVRFFRRARA